MYKWLLTLMLGMSVLLSINAQSPAKKILDHSEFDTWKEIQQPQISNDGRWVVYELNPDIGDGKLFIYDGNTGKDRSFNRGKGAKISADSRFVVFSIKPFDDTLKAQRRRKVKREDLPKDTLAILDLNSGNLTKIADVQSFQLPAKWSGWLAYLKEPAEAKADTTKKEDAKAKKAKKESRENGSTLVVRNLSNGQETSVAFVKSYAHAEEGSKFTLVSTGDDADFKPGVYVFDGAKGALQTVFNQKGDYKNTVFDKKGTQLDFIDDLDTTKMRVRPFGLYHWQEGQASAKLMADDDSNFLPKGWRISENANVRFSEDASKLYFGSAPQPILQDTSLLDEEIVKVEVWAYNDPVMPTVQNNRVEQEKKRSYECVLHVADGKIVQLATEDIPEIQLGNEGNAAFVLGYNDRPYGVERTWESWNKRDVYLIDTQTGQPKLVGKGIDGFTSLSPNAKYVSWYSEPDTAWFAYNVEKGTTKQLTNNNITKFYNELNDTPDEPNAYGLAAWLQYDEAMLIYDRYDIWRVYPDGDSEPVKLTNGRAKKHRIRYIRTDNESRFIELAEKILVSIFEEPTKKDGYAWFDLSYNSLSQLQFGEYSFANQPIRAKDAEKWIFTRENFQVFPDLLDSSDLKTFKQVSNARPQQKDYRLGTAELFQWTSLDGEQLDGVLVKPENFDPKKNIR
ncbi:MAG: hypothetical protein IPJ74_03350 [Saprospiraceae bacterium]|nr:hypothetical protein [Saprospiraceae bacterium]